MDTQLKYYHYKAKVISVYDGDTIDVQVDLGFNVLHNIKLRLFGINAPEIRGVSKEKGIEVQKYLSNLIVGKEVIIETFKFKKGKYGRYLGIVFLNGLNVNTHLIEKGLVKEYII